MSSSGFVEVEGGELFYCCDGSGPAVVLVHGAPTLDHRVWEPQIEALAVRYRVIRYDLRGYGRSALPTGPYRHCDDLAALLVALGVDEAVLCGLSFGGTVALDTALAHPGMVRGLIFDAVAPVTGWKWVEGFPLAPALKLAGSATTLEVAEAILALPMHDAARERPKVVAALRRMSGDYSGWHLRNPDPGDWAETRQVDRLGEIAAPTIVVTGGRDVLDVRMIGERVASDVPGAYRVEIPNAGHMPSLEEPAAFNQAAIEFLDNVHDRSSFAR